MSRRRGGARTDRRTLAAPPGAGAPAARITDVHQPGSSADPPAIEAEVLNRLAVAEDTLRAIGAGEVDAFVVSDEAYGERVFTLTTADRPYRTFVENMRDGAATLSPQGVILYANQRLAELLGSPRESIVGSPLAMFTSSGSQLALEEICRQSKRGADIELDLVDSDGNLVPVLVGTGPLGSKMDDLTCLTFADLSAHKAQDREIARLLQAQANQMGDLQRAQKALTQQATHDALTGLPNRGLLVDRIEQALSQARRSGRCTAVLFLDLDRFKHVNDTFGHMAGDEVLRTVAHKLSAALRPMDTVARIGGDEFGILAPDVDDCFHAVDIGARLVAELGCHPHRTGGTHRIEASLGVSLSASGRGTAEIMLSEADAAMYHAKSLGGDRAELFDEALGRQVAERLTRQETLQTALDDHRVVVRYQPIIDLSSGEVAGFEALARIAAKSGSMLPPATFVAVAEDTGLVVPLGAQVLGLACGEARRWPASARTGGQLTVAVNLSARQFDTGDLTTIVRSTLERTGLDPACLYLELTETAIMDLRPDVLQQLDEIEKLGVQIGLDDFGTGYSSLTHLSRLPLSFVKIDQSFVHGIDTDHDDERIVAAVVSLAASLGLQSIAEGVETEQQLIHLRELGCDQAQGYLFAEALAASELPSAVSHKPW